MRELNVMEIDAVSGAGLFSSLTSAILGATAAGCAGAIIGGCTVVTAAESWALAPSASWWG